MRRRASGTTENLAEEVRRGREPEVTSKVAACENSVETAGARRRAVIWVLRVSTEKLVADLHHRGLVAIDRGTLLELIDAADVLREDDTHLAGWIRILAVGDSILVQEETPKGEVLVRRMPSRESADSFVDLRIQSYERMWDGCGCKVDYYAEWSDESCRLDTLSPGAPRRR